MCRATFWWLGTIEKVGTIPARSMHYSASECRVRLRPGCGGVNIVASVPHTHITGVAIWSEMYERDTAGHLSYVRCSLASHRLSALWFLSLVQVRCQHTC